MCLCLTAVCVAGVVGLGDVSAGQHLGRVPPALVVITNPGERGLIPAQPFWPAPSSTTTTTIPAQNPISPPSSEHTRAHLNEVESGVLVQDHGYRKAPPGFNQPLPRLVLAALFQLEADDHRFTTTATTPDQHTTNLPIPPLKADNTPSFVPSPPHPLQTTPQLSPARDNQLPSQPHTGTQPELESRLQSLSQEDVRPASSLKGGTTLAPIQVVPVHQRTPVALPGDGAANTQHARHRPKVQPLLGHSNVKPHAMLPFTRPMHTLVSTPPSLHDTQLVDATQMQDRPLPTHIPAPRPHPLQPPTRPSPGGRLEQPVLEPTLTKGFTTTTHPKSEDDYYYYYYSDDDYHYYDDYGNSPGKDGGGQQISHVTIPTGPPVTTTTTTTSTTTSRPRSKGPITLPPSFFGLPHARRRPARPQPKHVDRFTPPFTHSTGSIPLLPPPHHQPDSTPHHQPDSTPHHHFHL